MIEWANPDTIVAASVLDEQLPGRRDHPHPREAHAKLCAKYQGSWRTRAYWMPSSLTRPLVTVTILSRGSASTSDLGLDTKSSARKRPSVSQPVGSIPRDSRALRLRWNSSSLQKRRWMNVEPGSFSVTIPRAARAEMNSSYGNIRTTKEITHGCTGSASRTFS